MQEQTLSSYEARQQWRLVTMGAIAGKTTIVTHYGDEVGAFLPIDEYREYRRMKEALAEQQGDPAPARRGQSRRQSA